MLYYAQWRKPYGRRNRLERPVRQPELGPGIDDRLDPFDFRHAGRPVSGAGLLCHLDLGSERVQLDFYYLGKPFDPSLAAEPDFSGTQEGGFGVYIIEHAVDEVRHARLADRVNRVSLLVNANLPETNISPQS